MVMYFKRNERWLVPLVVACILVLGPMVMAGFKFQDPSGAPVEMLPSWMKLCARIGAIISLCCAAFWAQLTPTLSGHVARILLPAYALSIGLAAADLSKGTLAGIVLAAVVVLVLIDRRDGSSYRS